MTAAISTLALICLSLLGIGVGLVGLLTALPATRAKAWPIWPVLLTEALIVGAVVVAALAGGAVLVGAVLALALRVAYEAARVGLSLPPARAWLVALGWAALCGVGMALPFTWLVWAVLAAACLLGLFCNHRIGGPWAKLSLFPGLPLVIYCAAAAEGLAALLLIAFLLVETFDSYALLGGKLFGRRLAFPRLSPRKTVEGLGLGALMLILTAGLLGPWLLGAGFWASIGAAALAGVLSVVGDLAASRIKRAAGVKDYPAILPHQGGLFDIADAWVTTGAGFALVSALW